MDEHGNPPSNGLGVRTPLSKQVMPTTFERLSCENNPGVAPSPVAGQNVMIHDALKVFREKLFCLYSLYFVHKYTYIYINETEKDRTKI